MQIVTIADDGINSNHIIYWIFPIASAYWSDAKFFVFFSCLYVFVWYNRYSKCHFQLDVFVLTFSSLPLLMMRRIVPVGTSLSFAMAISKMFSCYKYSIRGKYLNHCRDMTTTRKASIHFIFATSSTEFEPLWVRANAFPIIASFLHHCWILRYEEICNHNCPLYNWL